MLLSETVSGSDYADDRRPDGRVALERVFVGRKETMAGLDRALAAADAGHGAVVRLVGDAGIGKSRTLEEFARAAGRDHRVLAGRCVEGGGAPAFLPWTQVLESWLAAPAADRTLDAVPAAAADVAAIVPALRVRRPDLVPPAPIVPEQARFRFFDGFMRLLREAARQEALVIVLEDVHWADVASMRLLGFLAHHIGDVRLLVVASHRPLPADGAHVLRGPLAEIVRSPWCHAVPLEALTVAEVERFLGIATGAAPSAALVEGTYRDTQGNPLLVRESVRLLGPEPDGAAMERVAAARLDLAFDVLGARLHTLPDASADLLGVAAVLGREFDVPVLAEMTGRSTLDVLVALEPAVALRLVVPLPGRLGAHRFTHALLQERLYQDLPSARRAEMHLRAGRALEDCQQRCPDLGLGERLAYHFDASGPGGDPAKAAEWALRIAEQAGAGLAYEEAARQYERALRAEIALAPADRRRHCELRLRLGEARRLGADLAGTRAAFVEAAADARALGASDLLARAALGFAGRALIIGLPDPEVLALLDEALAALPRGDDVLRARVLGRLAMELLYSPEWARAAAVSAEAADLGRRLPDLQALSFASIADRYRLHALDVGVRIAHARELRALAEAQADVEVVLDSSIWLIRDLIEQGDLVAAAIEIDRCAILAAQVRHPLYEYRAVVCRALLACVEGRAQDAERFAYEYVRLGKGICPLNAAITFGAQISTLRRFWGPIEDLEALIADGAEQHPLPVWEVGRALFRAETGDLDGARDDLERLAPGFDHLPHDLFVWMSTVTLFAETVATVGDVHRAALLYDMLLPFAGRNLVSGTADCYGSAGRFLGRLATVLGRFDDAERHFVDAIAMNEAIGARPLAAVTRHAFAEMLLVRDGDGDRARAGALLDEALGAARALGMRVVEARVRALGARLASGVKAGADVPPTVVRGAGQAWVAHGRWSAVFVHDGFALRCLEFLLAHPRERCFAPDVAAAAHRGRGDDALEADVPPPVGSEAPENPRVIVEHARLNVTRAVRRVVAAIGHADAHLGRRLERAIRTGTYCAYVPDQP